MTERQYAAAPIVDAIIELRFKNELSDEERSKVSTKFASRYPLAEDLLQHEINVEVQSESIATHARILQKITKRTETEGPFALQIGGKILNVDRGAPYAGWDDLFERFRDDFSTAKKIWGYRPIERIGVRYINRIDLPGDDQGIVAYEDYLNLRINLPEEFPAIHGYNLMFVSALDDIGCGFTVRSGIAPPAVPRKTSFTLDIDVWKTKDVPQKDKDVLDLVGCMRGAKNRLFETFITEEARKLFDAR